MVVELKRYDMRWWNTSAERSSSVMASRTLLQKGHASVERIRKDLISTFPKY
jgi:hypothetical protein